MRVAINAQLLSFSDTYRQAGVSNYIYQLLRNLPRLDQANEYIAFLNDSAAAKELAAPRLKTVRGHLPTSRPPVRIIWEQCILPLRLSRRGVDVVHCPMHVVPFLSRHCKVVTIHDLAFMRFPHSHKQSNRLYLRFFTRWSLGQANRVIAVSESTRREIVEVFGFPRRLIDVVYNGVDSRFTPQPESMLEAFRLSKGLPARYALYLGTIEPRKNIETLLHAFHAAQKDLPADVKLVIAGGKGWGFDPVFKTAKKLGLDSRVLFPGFVPDADLPLWYSAAEVFAYPSLYEGFGLPPLESMACGTPVITSNTTSLPEVVGDAGIMVDPLDSAAMAKAIVDVFHNENLREEMRRKGLRRAAMFSWEETALNTRKVYETAMWS